VKWKPDLRTGLWVGAGIIVGLVLVDIGLVWRVVAGPVNGMTFVCALLSLLSLPAFAVIGYRIYSLTQLRYEFDRNQLVIHTAGSQQIIPTCSIDRLIDGRETDLQVRMRGLTWPGFYMGQGHVVGVGLTLFYAVHPPQQQMIVVTPTVAYGFSVPNVDEFVEVLATCQELGPSREVHQTSRESAHVRWRIWSDRWAQYTVLGGIILNLVLFGLLLFRYPRLPNLLPLHYDITGAVDRIGSRSDVFALPAIGLIVWVTNGFLGMALYRRERVASYIAWSGAAVVQIFFLLTLWRIVT
jgi:Bacterial PH domain/Domain of unknown function (DUF1648)